MTTTTTTNDLARVTNAFDAFVAVARQVYGERIAEATEVAKQGRYAEGWQVMAEVDALGIIVGRAVAAVAPASDRLRATDAGGDLVGYVLARAELADMLEVVEEIGYPTYRAELERLI